MTADRSKSRPARDFRLLVFDWDGTLMDSIATIVACTQAALADLGLEAPPEEKVRRVVGMGLRETIEELWPECDPRSLARIRESYRRHWMETFRDRPILYPGVEAMLRGMSASGYLLAVATGKSRRGLDHAVAQTNLQGIFHATRTVDEAPSKPNPKMLLDILLDLGANANEALVIGDTTFDLGMASRAGARAVGILSGTHTREDLERAGAAACLDVVTDVPAWLAG